MKTKGLVGPDALAKVIAAAAWAVTLWLSLLVLGDVGRNHVVLVPGFRDQSRDHQGGSQAAGQDSACALTQYAL